MFINVKIFMINLFGGGMKTDARVKYTKMVIKNSFIELFAQLPLNKITVSAICELADINRATFYKYYTDTYDLVDQLKAEGFLKLRKVVEKADSKHLLEILTLVTMQIKEHSDLYMLLFANNSDRTFVNQIFLLCYQTIESGIADMFPDMPKAHQEWVYGFLTQGCGGIMEYWVNNGMREDPQEVSRFIEKTVHSFIDSFNGSIPS